MFGSAGWVFAAPGFRGGAARCSADGRPLAVLAGLGGWLPVFCPVLA